MLLLSYIVIFILFSSSYTLNIISLILPKWLSIVEQDSNYTEYNIGLFQRCENSSGECRSFPSQQNNDCKSKEFCILWKTMISCNVTSLLTGLLVMICLLGIIFCHSGYKQRQIGWKMIIRLLLLYSFPLILSCFIFLYLTSDTSNFTIPILYINYNISFILNIFSWCINLVISLSMLFSLAIIQNHHYY